MSDPADPEFDPGSSPSIPSQPSTPVREPISLLNNDDNIDEVDRKVGEALMQRDPLMRGSLTFLRTYTHLLAQSKKETDFTWSRHQEVIFQVSQYGSVVWTSTEKEAFFNALDRKGVGNTKELASAIGSKSELEVMEYIRRLHEALEAQYDSENPAVVESMPLLGDLPAAMEISQQGCEMLDDYADVLVLKESLTEAQAGEDKYGDHWNLTSATSVELMDVVDDEDDRTVRGDLQLAASLLYVPEWISLSRGLFMNFGGSKVQDHWRNLTRRKRNKNITAQHQTPSMTAESVVDFYALSVSITRRLVQSSIFFATSRLRGANRSGRDRKSLIRVSDVRAAIEVLNMKHRRPNFVDTARRNEAEIVDVHNRKDWVATPFTYEQAEEIIDKSEWTRYRNGGVNLDSDAAMSSGINRDSDEEDSAGSESDDSNNEDLEEPADEQEPQSQPEPEPEPEYESEPEAEQESESEPDPELENESEAEAESDSDSDPGVIDLIDPARASETPPPPSDDEDDFGMDPEERHANLADETTSFQEEAMFLRLMDQAAIIPEGPVKTEELEEGFNDRPERRDRDAEIDWRGRTIYRSEWEEYGYDFVDLKTDIELPPAKRRKFIDPPKPPPRASPSSAGEEDEDLEGDEEY